MSAFKVNTNERSWRKKSGEKCWGEKEEEGKMGLNFTKRV